MIRYRLAFADRRHHAVDVTARIPTAEEQRLWGVVPYRSYLYERENYTRSLRVAEGVTSSYDDLLVRRASADERSLDYAPALDGFGPRPAPAAEKPAAGGAKPQQGGLGVRFEAYPPGTPARLLVARRRRMTELPLRFGSERPARFKLEADAAATPAQAARRAAWFAPSRSAVPAPVA